MNEHELRRWYHLRVRRAFDVKGDMSLSPPACAYLQRLVAKFKPRVLLELGAGFSTLFLRQLELPGVRIYTAEHDEKWARFVRQLLRQRKLYDGDLFSPVAALPMSLQGRCDLVLVDHGPTMDTRLQDLPWLANFMTSSRGLLLLDDCRKTTRYASMAKGILYQLGWKMVVAKASSNGARALGVARRRKLPA